MDDWRPTVAKNTALNDRRAMRRVTSVSTPRAAMLAPALSVLHAERQQGRLRCTAAAEPCQPFRPAQHGRSTRAECCGCGNFLSSSAPFGQKKRLRFAGGPPDWRRAPFNAGEGMPEARRNRHNRHTTQQTQRRGTFCETVQIQQINDRQQQLSAGKVPVNRAKLMYIHLVWAIFTSSYSAAGVLGGTCHWLSPSWGGRGG